MPPFPIMPLPIIPLLIMPLPKGVVIVLTAFVSIRTEASVFHKRQGIVLTALAFALALLAAFDILF
jgi:hypothetical protein